MEVTPQMLNRIEAGSSRLYHRDFLGLSWLADYVADVDSVCMAYEDGRLMEGQMTTTESEHVHSWAQDDFMKGIRCVNCGTSGWDWTRAENRRLEAQVADWKRGSDEEARAGDEARAQAAQLRERVALLTSAIDAVRAELWPQRDFASHSSELCDHQLAIHNALALLARLDAAVPAASTGKAE